MQSIEVNPDDAVLLNDLLKIRSVSVRDHLLRTTENSNALMVAHLLSIVNDLDQTNIFCHNALSQYHHILGIAISNFLLSKGKPSSPCPAFNITLLPR